MTEAPYLCTLVYVMDTVLHIRLSEEILAGLDRRAASESRSRNAMARLMIAEGADIAQTAEQPIRNRQGVGSTPAASNQVSRTGRAVSVAAEAHHPRCTCGMCQAERGGKK